MALVEAVTAAPMESRRLRLSSPATLERIGEFEPATTRTVSEVIARAREAQPAWAALGVQARSRYLQRALDVLLARREAFIDQIVLETGRSRLETMFMEILPACDSLNYYSRRARKMLRDRAVGLHLLRLKRCKLVFEPLGVVGVISPWNGPFILSLNPTVQALVAGNAVIVKPSEVTPFSGRLVEALFKEAGLPPNVVQVVLGDGETGAAVVEGGVDKISFTGSVATGRKVGEACGRNLIPCTLELGGKDPMIVCSDADLDRAARGAAFGAFMNNGQFCCGTERVYVVDSVADAFTARVAEAARTLRVGRAGGDPRDEYDLGPFIAQSQIEIVERHVADAVAKGARVVVGGRRVVEAGQYFYEPTVLTNVTHEMLIMREETFGPVLPIIRCGSEADAVRLANDSTYGLSATVWSRDPEQAEAIARAMESGSVCVNDTSITYGALEVPFGGRKNSGIGYVNGEAGLLGYCHAKPILFDRLGLKSEWVWYPYTGEKLRALGRTVDVMFGRPLRWLLS